MRLYEFFNQSTCIKSKIISQHQKDIERDIQSQAINVGKPQEIMNIFKVDPATASHMLDTEAEKARQVINNIENDKDRDIEDSERERVLQLVQSISDISAYEESQFEVDRLVAQYIRNKK
jgi:hypothetical protein